MSRIALAVAAGAALLALTLTATGSAHGQQAAEPTRRPPGEVLLDAVALGLGEPRESVRATVEGDLPEAADSLSVVRGTADRWIVTVWTGEQPVRRFARVGVARAVPVAARRIARGEGVAPEDVRVEKRVVWHGDGRVPRDPVGMVALRVVPEGAALVPPAVRPPLLFRGGDEVEAVLTQSGVELRVRAEALRSAREGDSIHVRLPSGRRLDAVAVGPGLVHLISGGAGCAVCS